MLANWKIPQPWLVTKTVEEGNKQINSFLNDKPAGMYEAEIWWRDPSASSVQQTTNTEQSTPHTTSQRNDSYLQGNHWRSEVCTIHLYVI